jgi:hypothetical protein
VGFDATGQPVAFGRIVVVLMDWDLWGTKVSGSRELVAAIADDPGVETTSVPSAPPAPSG